MKKAKRYLNKILAYMDAQEIRGKIPFMKIFVDLVISNILYGATISDYFLFRFYEKSAYHRKDFMTARHKNRFYAIMNDLSARKDVQNKDVFNQNFSEYLKRDSISIPECDKQTFCEFIRKHKIAFIKPVALGGGEGIIKILDDTTEELNVIYDSVCLKGTHVVEAGIIQHQDMASLHPESVNTIRITTFFDGETVKILFASMRCGVGNAFVDNHMLGGIAMRVDHETGKVASLASSKSRLNILKHPDTNVFLPGFQIPHWDKCVQLINCVARQVKNVRYVGWDIAILPEDVCLIEANPSGDFSTLQEPTQIGCRKEMDKLMKEVLKQDNKKR